MAQALGDLLASTKRHCKCSTGSASFAHQVSHKFPADGLSSYCSLIRSDYISSSHTRLIRYLTLKGRVHSMQCFKSYASHISHTHSNTLQWQGVSF